MLKFQQEKADRDKQINKTISNSNKGMRKIKLDKMRGQVESLKLGGQRRFNSKYQCQSRRTPKPWGRIWGFFLKGMISH